MPTQYFVTPLDINKIKSSTINKLKDKFKYNETEEDILFSNNGYYTIKNNEICLFKINYNNSFEQSGFIKKYTLLGNDYFIKKTENITQLPTCYLNQKIKKLYFSLKNSNTTTMIIELKDNKVVKLYFTTKNNLLNDYFFNNDISLYLESLNI